jgi:hypothetical protein
MKSLKVESAIKAIGRGRTVKKAIHVGVAKASMAKAMEIGWS